MKLTPIETFKKNLQKLSDKKFMKKLKNYANMRDPKLQPYRDAVYEEIKRRDLQPKWDELNLCWRV